MNDPHEIGVRQVSYRKDPIIENCFIRLNQHLEVFDMNVEDDGRVFPTIFIVGLPRSGTTLLSQLISRSFAVGYIDNLIARFWLNPVVGIRLSKAVFGPDIRKQISTVSTHGTSKEPWGPHEFGYFWRHWLLLDESPTHKLPMDLQNRVDRQGLHFMLNQMAAAFQMPVLFKNIICGLQASLLHSICSNSLFIYIERNPEAVVSSILRCRNERYGDFNTWWSLKPSTFSEIIRISDPEKQVQRQVADGAKEMQEELSASGVNAIYLSYERMCSDPTGTLNKIASAMRELGSPVTFSGCPPKVILSLNQAVVL
jgi:hypothetical protein